MLISSVIRQRFDVVWIQYALGSFDSPIGDSINQIFAKWLLWEFCFVQICENIA